MNNRWCIIAGARSGSTWLENLIFESLPKNKKPLRLNEYILSPFLTTFSKDENNYVCENNVLMLPLTNDETAQIIQDRIDTISTANIEQPLTMRVFIRPNQTLNLDYNMFFNKLADINFKFVTLYRNIFDKSLSLYFMENTGIVHRWGNNKETYHYDTMQGNKKPSDISKLEPLTVNMSNWLRNLYNSYTDEVLRKKMTSKLDCPTVRYETLIDDCYANNIPIGPTEIIKTYELPYKDYILNYDELVQAYLYYKDKVGYEE
jgi:hypothetical protein